MLFVNNHNVYVETHGPDNGPVVILLHHGLGSTRAWRAQIPALVSAGYRVIAYDRWGYGGSDPRPALDVPSFAIDLADLCLLINHYLDTQIGADSKDGTNKSYADKENPYPTQTVNLIGHSDGGTLALYFASKYPKYVSGLVTVAAHIYVEPKMLPGIEGVQLAFEHDPRFSEGLRRLHGQKTESVFNNWYTGWHKTENIFWDMRPLLGNIKCPALIVQGLEDEHATPQHARDIAAAIPSLGTNQTKLWLVEGAGHMFPQEMPEVFNHGVLSFLQDSFNRSLADIEHPADTEHPADKGHPAP